MNPTAPRRSRIAVTVLSALLGVPVAALAQQTSDLGSITVTDKSINDASRSAPSQGSLDARTAQSIISDDFIRNYTAPTADYAQILSMTPGIFAYSPNGVGLTDAKVTMRGLSDAFFNITFDGIPFNDTNGVSHHSWVFFPGQFLGGAVVDRSPGTAATIGQATFGGTIDLRSRVLEPGPRSSVEASYGSWNTRLLNLEEETGNFGAGGSSNLLFNVQKMKSNGYQTYNDQDRTAASAKYRAALSSNLTLTVFADALDLKNNTPSIKGLSRTNYNAGNYTYLLSSDPARGDFYGYNFYKIVTGFFYAGLAARLDGGWSVEDKVYAYSYHNKQNYDNSSANIPKPPSVNSGVDKLNEYVTMGNLLRATQESDFGTLHTGLWLDQAHSHRYQIPTDPRTWVDQPAPNFIETYTTTTLQPYVEYEFALTKDLKVTPGFKYASYHQSFYHWQDNGGAVGTLGGVLNKANDTIAGGLPSVTNAVTYSDALPSLDVHYQLASNWSIYAQFAFGDEIPSTSIFDVAGAKVSPAPKATRAKTAQIGTVWTAPRLTASADYFHTSLDGTYTALPPDSAGNVGYVLTGNQIDQGVEAEANLVVGNGFSLYGNFTFGSLKYVTGEWVAGAPQDTETLAFTYEPTPAWSFNLQGNRVGRMYNDSKSGTHEAFTIDPVFLTNLYANYRIKHPLAMIQQLRVHLSVDNLFDSHSIVGIASPLNNASSSANPQGNDLLTILPGRSVSLGLTADF